MTHEQPAPTPPAGPIPPPGDAGVAAAPPASDAAAGDRWRFVRPLRNRDFRFVFGAVVISIFAAGMWAVVMVYAVIAAGGGPLELSFVAAANAIGLLLCAIPGGIVADRISRRLILRGIEAANLLAVASIVVVGMFGTVSVPQLAVVSFVLGAGAGFFFPAYSALLPRILPEQQLLAANGLEGAIRPAMQQAVGPAAGGMLLAALLPAQAAIGIVACHAVALLLLLFQRREPAIDTDGEARSRNALREVKEALVFTARTPWLLWSLISASIWVLVTMGPEEVLLPFITRDRIGEDPRLFGFLLAAYGLGGVVGSIVVSSRRMPRRYLTVMMLTWGFSTLPYIFVGFTDQYWLLMASCFTVGFGFSYGIVIWGTLLQRRVPTRMLGRISSLDFFVSLAFMPLSMALAGPVAEVVPLPVIFTVAAIVPLVACVVALLVARMPQDEIAHPLDR